MHFSRKKFIIFDAIHCQFLLTISGYFFVVLCHLPFYNLDTVPKFLRDQHLDFVAAETNGKALRYKSAEDFEFQRRVTWGLTVLEEQLSEENSENSKMIRLKEFLITLRCATEDTHKLWAQMAKEGIHIKHIRV